MNNQGMGKLRKDQRLGWHLMPLNKCLRYSDGRRVARGRRMKMQGSGNPRICDQGMHAATDINHVMWAAGSFGKLGFEGGYISLVLVEGPEVHNHYAAYGTHYPHKFVGTHRTVLWMGKYKGPRNAGKASLVKWAIEAGCPRRLLKKVGAL